MPDATSTKMVIKKRKGIAGRHSNQHPSKTIRNAKRGRKFNCNCDYWRLHPLHVHGHNTVRHQFLGGPTTQPYEVSVSNI